ncbi:coiled-coil domain-containing protein 103 [Diceros bicornis minor]|uniref:coiled-coil domain-containing protein 103 n=1 Tax=Diceros bicornis minor TaxID=77932 RepID=UPI0026E9BE70|nr:coiled-coil domain-containing protein 103 [Diceros bicornis minor]
MERNDIINFKALEKELQAALTADEKYKRENAAKLRAVEQRVASYEEFRGIVLASHLKPLEQKDKIGGKRTVPWNCHTTQGRTSQDETTEISQNILLQPETSADFYRDWRRYLRSGPERYQALLQLGGPKLARLFQTDVGFGLLGELLVALADHVRPADRSVVLGILRSLASTGRFTLNLSLLSHVQRESCRGLFQKLQAMGAPRPMKEGLSQREWSVEELPAGLQEEERLLQELLGLYQMD